MKSIGTTILWQILRGLQRVECLGRTNRYSTLGRLKGALYEGTPKGHSVSKARIGCSEFIKETCAQMSETRVSSQEDFCVPSRGLLAMFRDSFHGHNLERGYLSGDHQAEIQLNNQAQDVFHDTWGSVWAVNHVEAEKHHQEDRKTDGSSNIIQDDKIVHREEIALRSYRRRPGKPWAWLVWGGFVGVTQCRSYNAEDKQREQRETIRVINWTRWQFLSHLRLDETEISIQVIALLNLWLPSHLPNGCSSSCLHIHIPAKEKARKREARAQSFPWKMWHRNILFTFHKAELGTSPGFFFKKYTLEAGETIKRIDSPSLISSTSWSDPWAQTLEGDLSTLSELPPRKVAGTLNY